MKLLLFALLLSCSSTYEARAKPAEPIWEWRPCLLPLDIITDAEMADKLSDVQSAVAWWNKTLGFVVFNPVNELTDHATVVVTPLVTPGKPTNVGETSRIPHSVIVVTRIRRDTPYPERVYIHELGHALGLDHSKDKRSVMYPTIEDGPFELLPAEKAALKRWLAH